VTSQSPKDIRMESRVGRRRNIKRSPRITNFSEKVVPCQIRQEVRPKNVEKFTPRRQKCFQEMPSSFEAMGHHILELWNGTERFKMLAEGNVRFR